MLSAKFETKRIKKSSLVLDAPNTGLQRQPNLGMEMLSMLL